MSPPRFNEEEYIESLGDRRWAIRHWEAWQEWYLDVNGQAPDAGYVYIIRCRNSDGYVKLGYSGEHPSNRVKFLQTGNPHRLWLESYTAGNLAAERFLQGMFVAWRWRGEWYKGSAYGLREFSDYLNKQATT